MKTHILHSDKLALELNAQGDTTEQTNTPDTVKALCRSLPIDTKADELWLPLVAVNSVTGIDGRSWNNTNPQAVIDATKLPFILDIDHASEMSWNTESSGWFTDLKIEDGHIQAKLELNSNGQALIDDKRYKFYSPAFLVNRETNNIMAFTSVGLTNKPNLNVPALNHVDNNADNQSEPQTPPQPKQELNAMLEALLLALGLSVEADQATALNTVQILKNAAGAKTAQPDLNAFVPKATHDQTVTELNTANAKLKELETAKHTEAVEVAINKAITDKKIAPADKDYFTAQCSTAEGLASFEAFINSKAAIIGADTELGSKPPSSGDGAELNSQDIAELASMGFNVSQ